MQTRSFSTDYILVISGRILPLFSLLLVTVMYAHALSLADYGIFQSVWMYANLVSVIMGYGISTIIFSTPAGRLSGFLIRNKKFLTVFYTALWALCILAFLVATGYSWQLKFLIVCFIVFQNVNTILETWLLKRNGARAYLLVNMVYSAMFFLWHFYVLNSYSLVVLISGIAVLAFLKCAALLVIFRPPAHTSADVASEKQFYAHWVFTGLHEIVGVFGKWIDKLILVYLLTSSEFAIFFNGSIEVPLLAIFVSMTGNYMMMRMSAHAGEKSQISAIFKQTFILLSSAVFPLFFFLFFFRQPVFVVFFSEKYLASLPIFAITLLIVPLRINNYAAVLQVFSRGNLVLRGSVLDLILAIVFILILYPLYGMQGAAAALVISTVIQIGYYLFHTSRLTKVPVGRLIPFRILILRLLFCGGLFFLLMVLTQNLPAVIRIAIGVACVGLVTLFLNRRQFMSVIRMRYLR